MLLTTEFKSFACRSNDVSVRLRRSRQTAPGRPASIRMTRRINVRPRRSAVVDRTCLIGLPLPGLHESLIRLSLNRGCNKFIPMALGVGSSRDCKHESKGTFADAANVRFGSKADISRCDHHVRFTPKSGHSFRQRRDSANDQPWRRSSCLILKKPNTIPAIIVNGFPQVCALAEGRPDNPPPSVLQLNFNPGRTVSYLDPRL